MNIEADNVSAVIDGREILSHVSLNCSPGQMTALVGPSGCGKTTLLHCLGLLQVPTGGSVRVDGEDTVNWKPSGRRRFWQRHSAFILQDHGVMEEESVAFNVTMALSVLGQRAVGDLAGLETALDETGLSGRGAEMAAHLSGGEKQRLGIARAIYKNAKVVFADEPTASLDDGNRTRVIEQFAARAAGGCTVIIATHDDKMVQACHQHYSFGQQLQPLGN